MRMFRRFLGIILLQLVASAGLMAQEMPDSVRVDSLSVPSPFDFYQFSRPMGWSGYDAFIAPLHEGFNAQFSLSAIMGMGHHAPSGVGFGKDIQMAYAGPIKDRLSYTLGAVASLLDWGRLNYQQVGVGGSLNAAVSDRVMLSLTGYKSLSNSGGHYGCGFGPGAGYMPWCGDGLDHYIGAAAMFKVSDAFFFQVSVGSATFRENTGGW